MLLRHGDLLFDQGLHGFARWPTPTFGSMPLDVHLRRERAAAERGHVVQRRRAEFAVQAGPARREVVSADRRMRLRIGVRVGDVV
jgi:hypothetical protein